MRYYFVFTTLLIFSSQALLAKAPSLGPTFAHKLYYTTLKKSYKEAIQTFKNANRAEGEGSVPEKEVSEEALENRLELIHQGEKIIQDMSHRPGDIDDQTLKIYHEIYVREFKPVVGKLAKYKPKPLPKSSAYAKAPALKPAVPATPPPTPEPPAPAPAPAPAQTPPPAPTTEAPKK